MNKSQDEGLPAGSDYEKLLVLEEGLEIWKVHIDSLKEQDKNARYMDKFEFERLSANIKKDKRLESLPFCYWNEKRERAEIISGAHRVRATRAADKVYIYILIDTGKLTRSQIISKQLAHNALVGKDDKQILKELFEEIDNLEQQFESGINPDEINAYVNLDQAQIENINFKYDYQVMQLLFLPSDMKKVIETFDFIMQDCNCLVDIKVFKPFIEAMRKTSDNENVRNVSAILLKMCELIDEYYESKK